MEREREKEIGIVISVVELILMIENILFIIIYVTIIIHIIR